MAFIINSGLSRLVPNRPLAGPLPPPPPPAVGVFTYIAPNYPQYRIFLEHLDPGLDPAGGRSPRLADYLRRNRASVLPNKFARFSSVGWSHYEFGDLPFKSAIVTFAKLVYFEFHAVKLNYFDRRAAQPKAKLHKIRLLHPDYSTAYDWWLSERDQA